MKMTLLNLKTALLAAGVISVSACVYPIPATVQGGQTSAIFFEQFPPGATITVDGKYVGAVEEYDGKLKTLAVPTGPHVVVVARGDTVLLEKKVYVGRDSALKISP